MSVWSYRTTAASWQGEDGIVHRLRGARLALRRLRPAGVLIALPSDRARPPWPRRGGRDHLANVGRAIPTLGVLILFAVSPLGLTTADPDRTLVVFAVRRSWRNAYSGWANVDRDARSPARGMGMSGRSCSGGWRSARAALIAAGRPPAMQVVATATLAGYTGNGTLGQIVFAGSTSTQLLVVGGAILSRPGAGHRARAGLLASGPSPRPGCGSAAAPPPATPARSAAGAATP